MSVTFTYPSAPDVDSEDPAWGLHNLNLSSMNAGDLLRYLAIFPTDMSGGELPVDLVEERCRERLRLIRGNIDVARQARETVGARGARAMFFGRDEGYCHDRAASLLELCLRASSAGDVAILFY